MAGIAVTGGAGFIGSNLVRALHDDTRVGTVRVLDDLSSGERANLTGLDVELIEGDVRDPAAAAAALQGMDSVVHLAAQVSVEHSMKNPLHSHDVNATGTLRVLDAARSSGVGTVVLASSCAVYGSTSGRASESDPVAPQSPYAASKAAAESYALAYGRELGLQVLTLRFFNVYGPGQRADGGYAAVIPAFIRTALAGRPLQVHGDGEQTRDFVYVQDVCRVLAQAALAGIGHEDAVNLASGTSTSILDLIVSLEKTFGLPLARDFQPARTGDVQHSSADISRLRSLFPQFEPTPFDIGLAQTCHWAADSPVSFSAPSCGAAVARGAAAGGPEDDAAARRQTVTAVPEHDAAELAALLATLTHPADPPKPPPAETPADAIALYEVATRLVELQLRVLERGAGRPAHPDTRSQEIATTRDLLRGTRQVLLSALDGMTAPPASESGGTRRRRRRRDHR